MCMPPFFSPLLQIDNGLRQEKIRGKKPFFFFTSRKSGRCVLHPVINDNATSSDLGHPEFLLL